LSQVGLGRAWRADSFAYMEVMPHLGEPGHALQVGLWPGSIGSVSSISAPVILRRLVFGFRELSSLIYSAAAVLEGAGVLLTRLHRFPVQQLLLGVGFLWRTASCSSPTNEMNKVSGTPRATSSPPPPLLWLKFSPPAVLPEQKTTQWEMTGRQKPG